MDSSFFVLSKLAWIVLSPMNILMLLVILATVLVFVRKASMAKWLLLPVSLFSVSLLFYPVGDLLIHPLEARFAKPISLPADIDGIIILGGGEDLTQSVNWGTVELGSAGDRYISAAILARRYKAVPVIFSGGSGLLGYQRSGSEAHIAKQLLAAVGIDDSRLVLEAEARNTAENFLLLKLLLPKTTGTYLLVTSAYHMPRSVGIARQQQINIIPYPVDYRSNVPMFWRTGFSVFGQMSLLETAWREWIGLTVYYWTGKTDAWLPE